MTDSCYHIPVLLKESIDGLNIQPDGVYVDVTFGGGGHSRELLSRLGPDGHLYSFDQDADAELNIRATGEKGKEQNMEQDARFTFVRSNFRYLKNWMRYYGVDHIDGLLADLGVSSHHFDDETRGFSFRFNAPLDMRMNKRSGQTAADLPFGTNGRRSAEQDRRKETGRHLLPVWGTENGAPTGSSHREETGRKAVHGHTRPDGRSQSAAAEGAREKRHGQGVPGPAHRSEPRDGCPERNAEGSYRADR